VHPKSVIDGNFLRVGVHYFGMDCTAFREAISALLDDEDPGIDPTLVEAHLVGCAACRAFAAEAGRLHGWLRLQPAAPVPDLTQEAWPASHGPNPAHAWVASTSSKSDWPCRWRW
jgi:Putative zinc-finger